MKFAWFSLIALWPVVVGAQVTEKWVARYHGPVSGSADLASHIGVDGNTGNVYVTGKSQGDGTGFDYATVGYDSSGNQLWVARYNGPGNGDDIPNGIAVDSTTGNVYVTGESRIGPPDNTSDYATVAYDSSGNQLWVARYPNGAAAALAVDGYSGKIYVTGNVYVGPGYGSGMTVAYDLTGNQLWTAVYPGHRRGAFGRALAIDRASGNVYVALGDYDLNDFSYFRTVAYDSSGDQLWDQGFYGGSYQDAFALAVASSGTIYVAGRNDTGLASYFVTVAYAPDGTQLWRQGYGTGTNFTFGATAIAVDPNTEQVYVVGDGASVAGLRQPMVSYNSSGVMLWVVNAASSGIAVNAATGNTYATGGNTTFAYDPNGNQLWTAQSNGSLFAIAVDSNLGSIYVTGSSPGSGGGTDFTTIAYCDSPI